MEFTFDVNLKKKHVKPDRSQKNKISAYFQNIYINTYLLLLSLKCGYQSLHNDKDI